MKENEINIYFFDWFSKYCKKINLNYIFNREKELNPLSRISTPSKTLANKIVKYEYYPLEGIKLQMKDLEIEVATFISIEASSSSNVDDNRDNDEDANDDENESYCCLWFQIYLFFIYL